MFRFILFAFVLAGIITFVINIIIKVSKNKIRKKSIELDFKDSKENIELDNLESEYKKQLNKMKKNE